MAKRTGLLGPAALRMRPLVACQELLRAARMRSERAG
jgi:hypothetical protein